MKSAENTPFSQQITTMKIVLLGYMGSGKSTVGKILAANLKVDFLDLDDYIIKSEGAAIRDIFKDKGELYFRKKENEYLKEVLTGDNDLVLSTGGGTPCYGNNMQVIQENTSNAFYLKTSIKDLVKRLSKEKEYRPLIKNIPNEDLPEFIGKHLFERSFFYAKANHAILGDGKTPIDIAKEIEQLLI